MRELAWVEALQMSRATLSQPLDMKPGSEIYQALCLFGFKHSEKSKEGRKEIILAEDAFGHSSCHAQHQLNWVGLPMASWEKAATCGKPLGDVLEGMPKIKDRITLVHSQIGPASSFQCAPLWSTPHLVLPSPCCGQQVGARGSPFVARHDFLLCAAMHVCILEGTLPQGPRVTISRLFIES